MMRYCFRFVSRVAPTQPRHSARGGWQRRSDYLLLPLPVGFIVNPPLGLATLAQPPNDVPDFWDSRAGDAPRPDDAAPLPVLGRPLPYCLPMLSLHHALWPVVLTAARLSTRPSRSRRSCNVLISKGRKAQRALG